METPVLRAAGIGVALLAAASTNAQTLLVHLPFEEGAGTEAVNQGATGAANDATLGANTVFAAGQIGSGLTFDGSADSNTPAGSAPITGGAARTTSVWVNTSGGAGNDTPYSWGNNSDGGKWDVDVDNNNGGHVEIGVGGGRTSSSGVAVNDGQWNLITVVLPEVNGPLTSDIDFYVNGQFAYDGDGTQVVNTGTNGLNLGRCANGNGCNHFLGSIDDVAIWDAALTANEVEALYVGGTNGVQAFNAGDLGALFPAHRAGASAVVDGILWTYQTGLAGSIGVTGGGSSFTWVLDDVAGTGMATTGLPVPDGDVDLDGSVDLDDFNIITANFKESVVSRLDGDLNADGFVDFADFRIWKDGSAAAASASIPEPTTLLLASAAILALLHRPATR